MSTEHNNRRKEMKLKRLAAGVLIAALVFNMTACGGEEEKSEGTAVEENTEATDSGETSQDGQGGEAGAEATDDDDYKERAVEVDAGALQAASTAIAVGNTAVPYSEYKTYYYFMENLYNSLLGSDVWKQAADETNTIGHEAIEDVLRMIIQVKVITKQAGRQGVVLEADEKEDADYNANKLFESLDPQIVKDDMINAPEMMKIFEENKLAEKMYNIVAGQVTSDQSATAVKLQQLFKAADDSNREQVRADMEKLQKKISSSDKSFFYHARLESEKPEIETVVGSLDARKNLLSAAQNGNIGTVSDVIEESDGFYIIYVLKREDEDMDTEYRNQVVSDEQVKAFQDAYTKWSKHYEVEVSDALLTE